jgi:putative flippase GtrA
MTRAQQVGVEPGLPEVPQPAVDESGEPGLLLRLVRDQRVAFLLVGGVNTAISLVLFLILSQFVSMWGGDGALLAAQSIAIPCAFAMHRRFVFRVHGHLLRDLGRFALVNVIPISVNVAVLPVLTKGFGVPVFAAQLAFTMVWVVCSYFLHRGFSFRRSTPESKSPVPR